MAEVIDGYLYIRYVISNYKYKDRGIVLVPIGSQKSHQQLFPTPLF